jgi:RNA polymerase sigma-70 factor (ECF subfamily)
MTGAMKPRPVDDLSGDDRTLIAAALRERNAYGRIVTRYEQSLARYMKRLLGAYWQSAEDLLQEVFIKAYVNLNEYDRSRPFAPWLYRIAHNEAVSFLRSRCAQPQAIDGEDAGLILERMSKGGDVNEQADLIRMKVKMQAAMAKIDAQYRDVLVLRFLEEKSYDDVADVLRIPPGTVATRIRRGLKRLKSMLEGEPTVIEQQGQHD